MKGYCPYGGKPLQKLNIALENIAKTLFVDDCNCLVCGRELDSEPKSGLCMNCLDKLPLNSGEICRKCGRI